MDAIRCSQTRLGVLISLGLPVLRAGRVLRVAEGKVPVNRVAQNIAIGDGAEAHRVPRAFGVGVGEEECPGLAAIRGFVEAGERAFAGGHDDGCRGVEGLDGAEVELLRHGAERPVSAAVRGAQDSAVGACRPRDAVAGGVDGVQVGGGGRGLNLPLGLRRSCRKENDENEGVTHRRKCIPTSQNRDVGHRLGGIGAVFGRGRVSGT